ncbi:MAG: hypothetical protein NTW86_00580 [Candidatus Sumerlaeota bacterium]|nr:hypothetical protein [Candidatus Sumerlaeota bacterium]
MRKLLVLLCSIVCLGGAVVKDKPADAKGKVGAKDKAAAKVVEAPAKDKAAAAKSKAAAKDKAAAKRKAPAGPAPAWSVAQVRASQPGAVFQDGEAIQLKVLFDQKIAGAYRIARVRCAGQLEGIERGGKHAWAGPLVDLAEVAKGSLPELAEEAAVKGGSPGGFLWTLEPQLSLRGSYAVYVKAGDGIEAVAATLAVVPKNHPGPRKDFFQMTNAGSAKTLDEYTAMTQRLGFKWIRYETGWRQGQPDANGAPGAFDWTRDDEYASALRKYQLYALICAGHAPAWARPQGPDGKPATFGRGKPATIPDNKWMGGFETWTEEYVKRYGDVVLMMDLFNEPWEGDGISGFGSTGAHLREMMRHAYAGAKRANKDFLVGGCDSTSENEDHLLCDPDIGQYVDFLSYHTFTRHATFGPYQAQSIGKWAADTESWVGAGVETPFGIINALAMGFKTTHWYFPGSLLRDNKSSLLMPSGAASQAAALNHFLTDMDYAGQPNPRCLPYLFVFAHRDGSPTQRDYKSLAYFSPKTWPKVGSLGQEPEKCTHEDLQTDIKRRGETWDQILPGGTFSIPDPNKEITVYDFDANPMPDLRKGDNWIIPMAMHQDFYITCTGGPQRLMELLRGGTMEGMTPVQIVFRDFVQRVEKLPPLRVTLQNAYNVPISGKAVVSRMPDGWQMETQQSFQEIPAGGQADVLFKVTQAPASPQNVYPFEVRVETDQGTAQWREEIHANVIARGTIQIDGQLDDWRKIHAVAQTFNGGPTETDSAVRYMKLDEELEKFSGEGFQGDFAAAYDDDNFYCMMRLNDPNDQRGVSMAKDEWYKMLPGTDNQVYEKPPAHPMLSGQDLMQLAFDFMPNAEDFLDPNDPMRRSFPFRQTDYEYSVYPTEENGTEVWRLFAPGTFWQCTYTPFSPNPKSAQGLADKCKAVAEHDGKAWTFEVAIPWTEMPKLKEHLAVSNLTNFGLRIVRSGGVYYTTQMRSCCKRNGPSWHPDYVSDNWSVDTQWAFEE